MSETRATMRARVQRFVGSAINQTVNDAIKDAHKEIQRRYNWRFMEDETTIDVSEGDSTFDLPSDFKQEKNPEMSDTATGYCRMRKIIKDGIEARDTSDEGRPLLYRIWHGKGHLYAKADSDYSFPLEYYKWLPALGSDTTPTGDNAAFVDEFREVIEAYAIMKGNRRLKRDDEADRWERRFEKWLASRMDDDLDIELANQDLQMEMMG